MLCISSLDWGTMSSDKGEAKQSWNFRVCERYWKICKRRRRVQLRARSSRSTRRWWFVQERQRMVRENKEKSKMLEEEQVQSGNTKKERTRKAVCMCTSTMDRALVSAGKAVPRMPLKRGMDQTVGKLVFPHFFWCWLLCQQNGSSNQSQYQFENYWSGCFLIGSLMCRVIVWMHDGILCAEW